MYDANTVATLGGSATVAVLGSDVVTVTGTGSGTFAAKDVGVNAVTVTGYTLGGTDGANYLAVQPGALSASVTPARLTYIATPASVIAGQTPGTLSGTVSGLLGGDTLTGATTGQPVWLTIATANSVPGLYAINGGGLSAGNYVFAQATDNAGALTMKPGSPPLPVQYVMTQLASDILSPQTGSPLSRKAAAPVINFGAILGKSGLQVVRGGIKLPTDLLSINTPETNQAID